MEASLKVRLKKIGSYIKDGKNEDVVRMPFGGGSGAGVSINPIAFIVIQSTGVKLLSVEHSSALDKLLDLVPDIVDRVNVIIDKQLQKIKDNSNNQSIEEVSKNITKKAVQKVQETNNIKNNKEQGDYSSGFATEYDETDM